jgi:transcriptional regulator
MYTPAHFDAPDVAFCHRVVRSYPFAAMTIEGTVSVLPWLLDEARGERGTLVGHVARPNAHADAVTRAAPAVVLFIGPHGYISPTWYQTAPAVPTWNYCAVQACGTPRVLDDAATRGYLDRLAARFEGEGGWRLSAQPPEYQAKMLRGIVAFDLPIDALHGKAKLSQNRGAGDRDGVIAALERSSPSDQELARWMRDAVD